MALTKEQRQELLDAIDRTGGNREVMLSTRVIPDDYRAMLGQVEREERTLQFGDIPPVRVILSRDPARRPNCPVHVNFHGGGFILPQNEDDDMYCAHLALGIHGIVVDVDYALTDRYPFPAAFDQAYAVICWVFEQCAGWNADAARVSAGGHSAGGNLTTVAAMKAARTGAFRLNLAILDYSANDNYMALTDQGNERTRAFSLLYADGDPELLKDPFVSPVYADVEQLKGFPTTLIAEAGKCPFVETNRRFGGMLEQAGVHVDYVSFPDSRHGFSVRMIDDWRGAQQAFIDAINAAAPVR